MSLIFFNFFKLAFFRYTFYPYSYSYLTVSVTFSAQGKIKNLKMALTLMALLDPPLPSGRWQPMWVRVGNIWPPRADRVVQGEEYDRIQCWLNVRIYDRGESGRV